MIYNKQLANTCVPILALSPFSSSLLNVGEQGRTGLSGPNVELIAFNSGDFDFTVDTDHDVAVGLGVAIENNSSLDLSELGVVMSHQCVLSNFEVAYSGNLFYNEDSFIRFELIILRSATNNGSDYIVPGPIIAFTTVFDEDQDNVDRSKNILITTPTSISNSIVFPGDRLVLRVLIVEIDTNTSLTVGASVSCTPSV